MEAHNSIMTKTFSLIAVKLTCLCVCVALLCCTGAGPGMGRHLPSLQYATQLDLSTMSRLTHFTVDDLTPIMLRRMAAWFEPLEANWMGRLRWGVGEPGTSDPQWTHSSAPLGVEVLQSVGQLCQRGNWKNDTLIGGCTECSRGQFTARYGQTDCDSCPAATFNVIEGAASSALCSMCPPGTFSNTIAATQASDCQLCPHGQYSSTFGQLRCATCRVGTYWRVDAALGAITASEACTECPVGFYGVETNITTDGAKADRCLKCPPGTITSAAGSAGSTSCIPVTCSVGFTKTPAGECEPCPPGTFWTTSGTCNPCPTGQFQPLAAQSTCVSCPATHPTCPAGSRSESVCRECTAGMRWMSGATSNAGGKCAACPFGTALNLTTAECVVCSVSDLCTPGTVLGNASSAISRQDIRSEVNNVVRTDWLQLGVADDALLAGVAQLLLKQSQSERSPSGSGNGSRMLLGALHGTSAGGEVKVDLLVEDAVSLSAEKDKFEATERTIVRIRTWVLSITIGVSVVFVVLSLMCATARTCNRGTQFLHNIDLFSASHHLKPGDWQIDRPTIVGGSATMIMFSLMFAVGAELVQEYIYSNEIVVSSLEPIGGPLSKSIAVAASSSFVFVATGLALLPLGHPAVPCPALNELVIQGFSDGYDQVTRMAYPSSQPRVNNTAVFAPLPAVSGEGQWHGCTVSLECQNCGLKAASAASMSLQWPGRTQSVSFLMSATTSGLNPTQASRSVYCGVAESGYGAGMLGDTSTVFEGTPEYTDHRKLDEIGTGYILMVRESSAGIRDAENLEEPFSLRIEVVQDAGILKATVTQRMLIVQLLAAIAGVAGGVYGAARVFFILSEMGFRKRFVPARCRRWYTTIQVDTSAAALGQSSDNETAWGALPAEQRRSQMRTLTRLKNLETRYELAKQQQQHLEVKLAELAGNGGRRTNRANNSALSPVHATMNPIVSHGNHSRGGAIKSSGLQERVISPNADTIHVVDVHPSAEASRPNEARTAHAPTLTRSLAPPGSELEMQTFSKPSDKSDKSLRDDSDTDWSDA